MVRIGVIGYGKQGQLYSSILSGTPHWGGSTAPQPKECVLTAESSFAHDYVQVFENFADCILRGAEPIASGRDGHAQVELANAIQLSGWTGREITLPCSRDEYDQYLAEKMREESAR